MGDGADGVECAAGNWKPHGHSGRSRAGHRRRAGPAGQAVSRPDGLAMKIRKVTATPINFRLEAPYVWAFGELDGFSPTIVQVETEDGLVGLGEAPTYAAAKIIEDTLAPRLIGRD